MSCISIYINSVIARDAVAVYGLSPTEIEIRWDSTDFGVVESHKVFHKPASAKDDEYHSISLDGETIFCVIPLTISDAFLTHASAQALRAAFLARLISSLLNNPSLNVLSQLHSISEFHNFKQSSSPSVVLNNDIIPYIILIEKSK